MLATTCPDYQALRQLADGSLPVDEVEMIASHLEGCEACARRVQGLKPADTLAVVMREISTISSGPEAAVVQELADRVAQLRPDATNVATLSPSRLLSAYVELLAPPQAEGELGWLGGYRVLQVLGAGGMGVVYLAEDVQLKRRVALKAMNGDLAADPQARSRFLVEAQAMAAIEHDHIVSIYQVGEDRGVPFLAMQLLQGESLDERLKREERLPLADVLRIGRETAQALSAAHERGLVHRDIKPGNVWLESSRLAPRDVSGIATDVAIVLRAQQPNTSCAGAAQPLGGARATGEASRLRPGPRDERRRSPTATGSVLGTPAYMAPEQASGDVVDQRSDLFSLGCVLYRMCTGRLPFRGTNTLAMLTSLATETPPPVRELNPDQPPDLAALVMRLLAKKPDERPQSAEQVVLALETISRELAAAGSVPAARELTPPARRWPWARMAVAASALVLAASLLAAVIIRIKHPDGQVTEIKAPPGSQIEIDVPPEQPAGEADASPLDALRREQIPAYELAMAGNGDPAKAPAELVAVLGETQLAHMDEVFHMAFSPDSQTLISTGSDAVRFWDLQSFKQQKSVSAGSTAILSPDGRRQIVLLSNIELRLQDAATGKGIAVFKRSNVAARAMPVFSADSSRWAFALPDNQVRLCDAEGKELQTFAGHKETIRALTMSADGSRVATWSVDAAVKVWDTATGQELCSVNGPGQAVLALSPDGKLAASISGRSFNETLLFDAANGQVLHTLPDTNKCAAVAFSPDGTVLAVACQLRGKAGVKLFKVATGELLPITCTVDQPFTEHLHTLALSPDGKKLAAAHSDYSAIWLFDLDTGKQLAPLPAEAHTAHAGQVTGMGVTPDGQTLVSAGFDGAIRLWDLAAAPPRPREVMVPSIQNPQTKGIWLAALSSDGKAMAAMVNWKVMVLDLETGKGRFTVPGYKVAFSRDSRRLAVAPGTAVNEVLILNAADGDQQQRIETPASVANIALSPDGKALAASTNVPDVAVRLWDVDTAKELPSLAGNVGVSGNLAFSPDGKYLAAGSANYNLTVWDLETRQKVSGMPPHRALCMAFSPDGQVLATLGGFGTIRLLQPGTGALLEKIELGRTIYGAWWQLTLAPDGQHLIAGNPDGTIYILRVATIGN